MHVLCVPAGRPPMAAASRSRQPLELAQVEVLPPHCGGVRAARRRALAPPADYGRGGRY